MHIAITNNVPFTVVRGTIWPSYDLPGVAFSDNKESRITLFYPFSGAVEAHFGPNTEKPHSGN